ncbi:MAG: hypothetical protein ACK58N_20045, partial [Synechocystis sp.]
MTRYRSYPSRPKKSSQRSDWGNLVLAVVLGVVGCTGLKLWLDSQPPGFSLAQLAQVSESVKQVANPNILVTTQRIQNPIAGPHRQVSDQT